MSLALSGSTFEKAQRSMKFRRRALKELLRYEIHNSTAMLEVCWH